MTVLRCICKFSPIAAMTKMRTLQIENAFSATFNPPFFEVFESPFGMIIPDREYNGAEDYRFGFNGFEIDNEVKGNNSNLSWGDFGYDPRLVRRLTMDQHTAKYPMHSPFIALGNNPILNKEIDGRDYDVYVNHNEKSIIIKASYLATSDNAKVVVKNIIGFWANQNGKFEYRVKTGKKQYETYNIRFELSEATVNEDRSVSATSTIDIVSVKPDEVIKQEVKNEYAGGYNIRQILKVSETSKDDKNVAGHESGHGLGMEHKPIESFGSNTQSKRIEELNDNVLATSVSETIGRAGLGNNKKMKADNGQEGNLFGQPINVNSVGSAPVNFDNGKIRKVK